MKTLIREKDISFSTWNIIYLDSSKRTHLTSEIKSPKKVLLFWNLESRCRNKGVRKMKQYATAFHGQKYIYGFKKKCSEPYGHEISEDKGEIT